MHFSALQLMSTSDWPVRLIHSSKAYTVVYFDGCNGNIWHKILSAVIFSISSFGVILIKNRLHFQLLINKQYNSYISIIQPPSWFFEWYLKKQGSEISGLENVTINFDCQAYPSLSVFARGAEGLSSCSTGTAVERHGKREVIDRVDENYIR